MAAIISDFISDSSHFQHKHTMISGSGKQRSPVETQYIHRSHIREAIPSPRSQPVLPFDPSLSTNNQISLQESPANSGDIIDIISSPTDSKSAYTSQRFMSQENILRSTSPYTQFSRTPPQDVNTRYSCSSMNPVHVTLPRSPASLGEEKHNSNTVKVQNLAHIQSFAFDDFSYSRKRSGRHRIEQTSSSIYEISGMPITDVIEMVAGLLTKIVTTNDKQHATSRTRLPQTTDSASNSTDIPSSVSAFHGKNVPNITILSYLSRIHKYCPTTYEVFLSLLVYFDRMTERINKMPTQTVEKDVVNLAISRSSTGTKSRESDMSNASSESPKNVKNINSHSENNSNKTSDVQTEFIENYSHGLTSSRFFVVDSYNIHRLVIAGVTCASKFFSDVFYTNSRYAKVGGLPLPELNHLELQFLLLNDFRLFIPVEELEVYGTMLVEFYAREVISQKQGTSSTEKTQTKDAEPPAS